MITRLFLKLTDYPAFRRLVWKPVYELLAKYFRSKEWSLMNYGYAPSPGEPLLTLHPQDKVNRYPIQLYYYLAVKVRLGGCDVLEVGSGRGGGAACLKTYLDPKSITGLDIAGNAVELANEYFGSAGISFVRGSAEQLPFADESFDVVINIESSHTYGSVPQFLSEVKRVLRPGGYLLCADIRTKSDMVLFTQQLKTCGLRMELQEDISDNVRRAIELEEPIKQQRITEHIPKSLQPIFKQFAGVKGSKAHLQLASGELRYFRFVLQKPL
ncbi:class I SAM-dependent methyltransferase [Segetibacter sp. 3557_3]|uniref:class I SAM-dependent methyltransferase n=1 Tax=Segetibacter sp. 3557_3 TaxID=2547429 RepID=UPI001404FEAF|nr:class I SAM-dependent methyltransferase [Segetibacter sp. 3557_3]